MKLKRSVGIDLGTTNSAIAVLAPAGNELVMFKDKFRRTTFPSVVGWDSAKEDFITGWEAWNRRGMTPAPVGSIKRKMGRSDTVSVGPHELTPSEVSAQTLKALYENMGVFLKEDEDEKVEILNAVITVPAYFDAPQIEATKVAAELVGIKVAALVQEPTAAAMYHAWKHGIGDGNFLVYDLGGGTFDVSVIRCLYGEFQVLGIDGDNYLGGDDFDRRLAEFFREHLVEQGYKLDLDIANNSDDEVRFFLLMKVAQEVKEALSTSDVQFVGRRDLFTDQDGNQVSLELEYSKAQFELLIEDFVNDSIACCHAALARSTETANVGIADIDHVLLVGGSTRTPYIVNKVTDIFASHTESGVALQDEPDTCVALGAAIYAANIDGLIIENEDTKLTITTPLYTHANSLRIAGRIEGLAVEPETVAILNQASDIAGLARPTIDEEMLTFSIEGLELPDVGRYEFVIEPCDTEGDALASFRIPAFRGDADAYKPTGSALSNPSVLAKDIYLEIARDGRAERQVLLSRGTSLPAKESFRFFTADNSGAVILRLFQNRFPIRTIHLTIPEDTDVGTPVNLDLQVDDAMTVLAGGEVNGQQFWAQIDAPPPREIRNWESVERLLDSVEDVGRALWGGDLITFRRRTDPLVAGVKETARTDPDKMQELANRLAGTLEEYQNQEGDLTPGWALFEATTDAIKRVVYRGDDKRQLGLSTEAWRQKLVQIEQEARQVYDQRDADGWSRLYNQAQAIWESLAQDEYRFTSSNSEEQIYALKERLLGEVNSLRGVVSKFTFSDNPETQSVQQIEINRIEADLEKRVVSPIEKLDLGKITIPQAKVELDKLFEAKHQIRKRLDKLPTLGLVSR